MTPAEAKALRPGTPVEWWHHRGSWKSATFLCLHENQQSAEVLTELGCKVYKRLESLRKKE